MLLTAVGNILSFPKDRRRAQGKHSIQGGWLTPKYSWVKAWKAEGSNLAEDSEFYLEFSLSGSWAPGLPAASVSSWLFPAHCSVLWHSPRKLRTADWRRIGGCFNNVQDSWGVVCKVDLAGSVSKQFTGSFLCLLYQIIWRKYFASGDSSHRSSLQSIVFLQKVV